MSASPTSLGPYGELREEPAWVTKNLSPIRPDDWCAMNWEGRGGHCLNCCWQQPAYAADPCHEKVVRFFYRCICFWHAWPYFLCCSVCSTAKLYAFSLGQNCAIINHCCPACCCYFCVGVITRHNIRKQLNIGQIDGAAGWVGDVLIHCFPPLGLPCASCCSDMQMQRAVPDEAWDWPYSIDEVTCVAKECKIVN